MMSSRCALIVMVAALAAPGGRATAPRLRGGADKGQLLLRVVNNASFPVTLANCMGNLTVGASREDTLKYPSVASVAEAAFFWVVPAGVAADCDSGCPECFFVSFALGRGGGLVARIGYEADEEDAEEEAEAAEEAAEEAEAEADGLNVTDGSEVGEQQEPDGAITGLRLVVTRMEDGAREAAVCGADFCSPDWEMDHAVAWNSTVDLIVQGSTDLERQPGALMLLRGGRRYRRWRWRRAPRRPRPFFRPPVWRRRPRVVRPYRWYR